MSAFHRHAMILLAIAVIAPILLDISGPRSLMVGAAMLILTGTIVATFFRSIRRPTNKRRLRHDAC